LLPVENPGYIFVRRVLQPWKKTTSLSTKKKGSSSSKPSTTSLRRHSVSESPQSMEEDTAPPRRNDTLLLGGMRATQSSFVRFTEPHGCTEEPPVRPHRSTRSSAPPLHASWYSNGFIITTEEEKKLTRLEKRLVGNVDFDDQALHMLGFHTDIYYMLGHLGWVQFPNGVSVNTHKEFALEILMTMVHILHERVLSLSFRLEGVEQSGSL
jgi:hypothetical protein